jgi:hypothetical protein
MTPLFKKLNYKGQPKITILWPPDSFRPERDAMASVAEISEDFDGIPDSAFFIGFAQRQQEVDAIADAIGQAAAGDVTIWIAYPKASSKRYSCDFNRDTGWEKMGEFGFEPVRQVAIDEDWSALRFRRVQHIKKMVRSFAMTEEGKAKTRHAQG